MITTQYGSPIDRILHLDEKLGMTTVEMQDDKGRTVQRTYSLHQLKADGGIKEIVSAAEKRRA